MQTDIKQLLPTTIRQALLAANAPTALNPFATIADIGALGWKLDGNTVGAEKWIGTVDNFDFPIRVNNTEVARFSSGNITATINHTQNALLNSQALRILNSGFSPLATAEGVTIDVSGANFTNIGLDVSASGALTNNWAIRASGDVVPQITALFDLGITSLRWKDFWVTTVKSGIWNGTAIAANFGGTGQTVYAVGDILYCAVVNTLSKRAIGVAGDVLTVAGGVPVWAAPAASTTGATAQSTPADPATTISLVGVMMGLAGSITPSKSGNVMIVISGDWDNSTNNNGAQVQMRTGTGAAPVNGVALTGTVRGSLVKFFENNNAQRGGWTVNCTITGLVVGTPYWIDISLAAITGGTARVRDISISAVEQ